MPIILLSVGSGGDGSRRALQSSLRWEDDLAGAALLKVIGSDAVGTSFVHNGLDPERALVDAATMATGLLAVTSRPCAFLLGRDAKVSIGAVEGLLAISDFLTVVKDAIQKSDLQSVS